MNNTIKSITVSCMLLAASGTLVSCSSNNNKSHQMDSKEMAEEQNEAKFNDRSLQKDADYIMEAYSNGLCEIEAAKRAKEYASAKETRDLASELITAHVKLNESLEKLAADKQVSLQKGLTSDQLEELKKNSDQKGVEYDKAYLSDVISKHEKSISLFEKAADKSEDADVRKLFSSSLTELRNHLDMAMNTKNMIK